VGDSVSELSLPNKAVSSLADLEKVPLPPPFYATATVAPIRRPVRSSPSAEDDSRRDIEATFRGISSQEDLSTKGVESAGEKGKRDKTISKKEPAKRKVSQPKRKIGVDSTVPMSPAGKSVFQQFTLPTECSSKF
jgi:hypothetical protein